MPAVLPYGHLSCSDADGRQCTTAAHLLPRLDQPGRDNAVTARQSKIILYSNTILLRITLILMVAHTRVG
eukprot:COSAG05_NODE_303_length_11737_cov_116.354270_15_plen_70_part_00